MTRRYDVLAGSEQGHEVSRTKSHKPSRYHKKTRKKTSRKSILDNPRKKGLSKDITMKGVYMPKYAAGKAAAEVHLGGKKPRKKGTSSSKALAAMTAQAKEAKKQQGPRRSTAAHAKRTQHTRARHTQIQTKR